MKVEATLKFKDGTSFKGEFPEEVLINQMNRPQNKRLYTCGVEFSSVDSVEVTNDG